jgi:DNA-binding response OmpR family regulator
MSATEQFVPRTVLLAHSGAPTREVIGGILQRRGHKVEVAGDVSEARRILESGGVEVLLVSLHLPPNGYQAVLETAGEPPATIVIGEQGRVVPGEVAQDPRVRTVLVRPFSLRSLFDAVEATSGDAG